MAFRGRRAYIYGGYELCLSPNGGPMVSEALSCVDSQLDVDIEVAARSRVPVLISAPPPRALALARKIVERSDLGGAASMLVCDATAGDDVVAALTESRLRTSVDRGTTTFLLPEVHVLSEVEQDAVMRLLDLRLSRPYHLLPRIISTCSVSLYDRVRRGAFDARLFHRLNVIHIVSPS